jgi:hypothetical protein
MPNLVQHGTGTSTVGNTESFVRALNRREAIFERQAGSSEVSAHRICALLSIHMLISYILIPPHARVRSGPRRRRYHLSAPSLSTRLPALCRRKSLYDKTYAPSHSQPLREELIERVAGRTRTSLAEDWKRKQLNQHSQSLRDVSHQVAKDHVQGRAEFERPRSSSLSRARETPLSDPGKRRSSEPTLATGSFNPGKRRSSEPTLATESFNLGQRRSSTLSMAGQSMLWDNNTQTPEVTLATGSFNLGQRRSSKDVLSQMHRELDEIKQQKRGVPAQGERLSQNQRLNLYMRRMGTSTWTGETSRGGVRG